VYYPIRLLAHLQAPSRRFCCCRGTGWSITNNVHDHGQSRKHEPARPRELAGRRLQRLRHHQQFFSLYRKARNIAHGPVLPPTQKRQAPASRLHDMHAFICTTRASKATRAITHKREAIRMPPMHKMLRATRSSPTTPAEAPPARRGQHTTSEWT